MLIAEYDIAMSLDRKSVVARFESGRLFKSRNSETSSDFSYRCCPPPPAHSRKSELTTSDQSGMLVDGVV